jgi:serine/threonine-protein kinase
MPDARLAWASPGRDDVEPILDEWLEGPRYLSLSPRGDHLVLGVGPDNEASLWVYDLTGRPPIPLTRQAHNLDPVWTRDGTRVAFTSNREGMMNLYWIAADGSEPAPERLFESPYGPFAGSWSADGEELLFWAVRDERTSSDILALTIGGERVVHDVLATEYAESLPRVSPDGRWLAYQSSASGRQEIWVRPYPGPGAPLRVSFDGGAEPVWARDSGELYFLERESAIAARIMGATVLAAEPELRLTTPRTIVANTDTFGQTNGFYDVAPDGRFLVLQRAADGGQGRAPSPVLVLNWFDELKRLVPTE